jgi:L-fucose mutarotase/ribose pyranase (RbsD/FucU family)
MPNPEVSPCIELQPKQGDVFDIVEANEATWIGAGGGRGGAKSRCIQSVMLARRLSKPGTIGAILMRNSDQVLRYHEEAMKRAWPQLEACYKKGERKIVLPFESGPPSEIQFTYAETLADVIRRFRSANYYDIAVDQAEQFTEEELREIKQAVRWPDVDEGTCKFLLSFNMGGVGIGFLRKKFHDMDFNPREDPKRFAFVHFFPYDNVEWSKPALKKDGLTVEDYYSWSKNKRREYCATRSDYGKELISQDDALVQRDFDGSWESLEGAFFARSFDRNTTVITPEDVQAIIKPWWQRWLSQDWARGHYCVTYWHARGELSPAEVKKHLGWDVRFALKVVITYREYIAGGEAASDGGGSRELDEEDIARKIVELTPTSEREALSDFFLSPDAFGKKNSKNTIAQVEGGILQAHDMPWPRPADNDRIGGWALMSKLFLATKRKGQRGDEIILISANCPELVTAVPLLMRDPKNLDDVLKTDLSAAKIDQDASDACRYGWKSMLEPGAKPREVEQEEKLREHIEAGLDEHSIAIYRIKLSQEARSTASEEPARFGSRRIRRL